MPRLALRDSGLLNYRKAETKYNYCVIYTESDTVLDMIRILKRNIPAEHGTAFCPMIEVYRRGKENGYKNVPLFPGYLFIRSDLSVYDIHRMIMQRRYELTTEEDKKFGIDKWVRLFKSKTWEELKMIAQDNEYLSSAAESMYLSNEDYNVIKVARERAEFLKSQAYKERKLAEQEAELNRQADEIIRQSEELSRQTEINSELNEENLRLRELLRNNGIEA